MDSRSTFRPRTRLVTNVVGTQKGRPTGYRMPDQAGRGRDLANPVPHSTPRRERERKVTLPRSGSAHAAKKSRDVRSWCARTANRHR